ncbi:MAG TPA: sulfotransferase, partial [Elainellaceae cyanobacterium]
MTLQPLIIAGLPRCGTTSLFRYLTAHPNVAPSYRKELNVFLGDTPNWRAYRE